MLLSSNNLLGSFQTQGILLGLFCIPIVYFASVAIYNIFFHPLRYFPGPVLFKISRIPYFYRHINGTLPFDMLELHEQYGNIVRIAPNELAFSHPDAWKDIHGHQKSGREFRKAQWFYRPIESEPTHVVNEEREEHGRLRRQLAHGFSEKSMRDQEPLIKRYVDLLISRLREKSESGKAPVVLSDWYNYCTFDIIGDLAFGEAFGCLEGSIYHTWIAGIFQGTRLGTVLQMLSFLPALKRSLMKLAPKSARESHEEHKRLTRAKMLKRMEREGERPDLINGLVQKKDELNLDLDKLVANAEILIIGGSETTASLLSGATYHILSNPSILARLTAEVRDSFQSEDEINLISVGKLTYMLACLNESLRIYPPIASGLPRIVPDGGAGVLGHYLPENTTVSIHHYALYRREEFFTDPNTFHPERFLDGDDNLNFANDRKDCIQPFSVGPRNCLGRNLAYAEMRLILCRVLFNFDLRLDESSRDWNQQRNYLMWDKGPLKVYLTPVTSEKAA